MGLEVRGCINQLELFTIEQALNTPGRFYASVWGGTVQIPAHIPRKKDAN